MEYKKSSPTRITFLLPNLRLYGGIKSSISMANALVERGHDVTIAYPVVPSRDGRPWYDVRKTAVQIIRSIQNLFSRFEWYKIDARLQPIAWATPGFLPAADVLVLTWWHDVLAMAGASPAKGQQIHFVRSLELWGGPSQQVLSSYRRPLARVVTSSALGDDLRQAAGTSALVTIANGLDPIFTNQPDRDTTLAEPPRVGVLYRVQSWKRMDDALEVLTRVQAQQPIEIVLFGETLERRHRRLVNAFDHWTYVPHPAGEALRDVYRSLDVFLFCSDETEAFGNPPFEAMACGVPTVNDSPSARYSTW
ncbi:MAG: glycosyltransferase family 4 protein [Gammaproteobacteria bacterium]|nr:glycosyltransferase family 4 protein [Gammaproteobacteria bacterium]